VLELRGVSAGYSTGTVLRDIDLTVPDHTVVALLGPNGAGKTTLLRVASGLIKPTSGQVLVDGVDMTGRAPYQLSRLGVCHVPEGRAVFPGMSVFDNLRLQAPPSVDHRAVARATEVFPQLKGRLNQRAGSLSGGEQQMVALAHAYAAEPKTVLLDEVSMGLAPKIVDEIFGHLKHLAAGGAALLLVEQYVSRALALADYVYILKKGQVTFAGEPSELRSGEILESYLGVSAT
jgi:branched-chain amino acid transport system ATP-binding protein